MNKKIFYVAGMLSVLAGSSMLAASANDSVDPNVRRMFHGRMHVDYVEDGPIVHVIQAPPSPHYNIQLPAMQSNDGGTTMTIQQMPAPANAGFSNGTPGNILGPNGLPQAGIQSNMRSLAPPPAASLPSGRLANHVATHVGGNMMPRTASQPQQAQGRPAMHVAQAPATVASYAPQQPVSGSQSSAVKTGVVGKLMPRGQLLH